MEETAAEARLQALTTRIVSVEESQRGHRVDINDLKSGLRVAIHELRFIRWIGITIAVSGMTIATSLIVAAVQKHP